MNHAVALPPAFDKGMRIFISWFLHNAMHTPVTRTDLYRFGLTFIATAAPPKAFFIPSASNASTFVTSHGAVGPQLQNVLISDSVGAVASLGRLVR